jgi:hypothetical protein
LWFAISRNIEHQTAAKNLAEKRARPEMAAFLLEAKPRRCGNKSDHRPVYLPRELRHKKLRHKKKHATMQDSIEAGATRQWMKQNKSRS